MSVGGRAALASGWATSRARSARTAHQPTPSLAAHFVRYSLAASARFARTMLQGWRRAPLSGYFCPKVRYSNEFHKSYKQLNNISVYKYLYSMSRKMYLVDTNQICNKNENKKQSRRRYQNRE